MSSSVPPNLSGHEAAITHWIDEAESGDPELQVRATGRIKCAVKKGTLLPSPLVARLVELLSEEAPWQAHLHVLQMLGDLEIPADSAEALCDCLQSYITQKNKFLRAWAFSGLHRLAFLYPQYRPAVLPILDRARSEESASVRARLRHLPDLRE